MLVEAYEERRRPFKSRRRFDPVDVLHYAVNELGHTRRSLPRLLARARALRKSCRGAGRSRLK